ncbi:MAG: polyphosphate kinase 1 [Xanthomonadaceae bacterium]|nr:polyphosphate kinase 1 [Xanthomonadaceae bacterium]MDE1958082.1 polyphosphate kinase 1 [Xanthomonadaceae bacterium]MDE2177548.1 polyphosphate kinase 1 [Xanthomonadaceae bacterium]MDE2244683.1 polyphosphate kinase 1 [Xanthomonadaceae bacterium]
MTQAPDLDRPELFLNRELAALEFNFRVLAQARDPRMPLLERLRFLCIANTNLDEYFEVRVAVLKQHLAFGDARPGADGLAPSEVLTRIRERALELVREQYMTWSDELQPALAEEGIRFLTRDKWTARQKRWLQGYFQNEILPVLSPLGLDPAHPFPRILNKSLNIAVVLEGRDAFGHAGHMALVRAPRSLPRLIRLPSQVSQSPHEFIFLAGLLQQFADEMFPGFRVQGSYQFRVTRNSELTIEEEEVENLANALTEELIGRGYARPVRLEIAENCPKAITELLMANFELSEADVYRCAGPVNLNRVLAIYDQVDRADLKFAKFTPRLAPALLQTPNVFDAIGQHDVLLHHPYESFQAVMELLRQAAQDPDVLAIKQTLYRVGTDSPLVESLVEAARAGKDVTVVVELRARFDEEANIRLANRLQSAGVQVVYGVVGYKTHAKMLLIVRREGRRLRRYVHLSTGNYHQLTSRLYTDIGLMTAHAEIGEDVHKVFQQMSGLGPMIKLKRLLHSPFTLHKGLMAKIERETAHARAGREARIIAKINALNEPGVIQALYRASGAGVEIDLIVRGGCTLRPGLPGISERIRVRSVVGRFLEHSRVYWFANDGAPELYCASADWMERNLLRRIEVGFPILDPELAARVYEEALANYLVDNAQAWQLGSDGRYTRVLAGDAMPHSAQRTLLAKICR